MPKVLALRGTGDEGVQWVEVHYNHDLRVTHIGERIGPKEVTEDLDQMVGRKFSSRGELNRALNGSGYILGDV